MHPARAATLSKTKGLSISNPPHRMRKSRTTELFRARAGLVDDHVNDQVALVEQVDIGIAGGIARNALGDSGADAFSGQGQLLVALTPSPIRLINLNRPFRIFDRSEALLRLS